MAVTALTIAVAATTGADVGYQSADQANGNSFRNRPGATFLTVYNGDSSTRTMTITAQQTTAPATGGSPALTIPNITCALTAGQTKVLGPFPQCYNDINGACQVSWSASTPNTVKIAPIDIS